MIAEPPVVVTFPAKVAEFVVMAVAGVVVVTVAVVAPADAVTFADVLFSTRQVVVVAVSVLGIMKTFKTWFAPTAIATAGVMTYVAAPVVGI